MKFLIDTADIKEIRDAASVGRVDAGGEDRAQRSADRRRARQVPRRLLGGARVSGHAKQALGLATVVALVAGCGSGSGPVLDTVSPASAPRNATVVITGTGLCGPSANCSTAAGEIQVGLDAPVRAGIVSYTATTVQIVVPGATPVGATELILTVDDTSSNALSFTVLP